MRADDRAAGEVLVLGAGVMGLTAALRLREAGYPVRIWAAARWPDTVSAVAAAIWYPFRAYPPGRVKAWAARTFTVLQELSRDAGTGVVMRSGRVYWNPGEDPYLDQIPDRATPLPAASLPSGYAHGAEVAVPVVEMPIYLGWMEARLEALGVRAELRAVDSVDEALEHSLLVVNCTGLGARSVADDPEVHPIRGQVARVANPGIERFALDAGEHAEEIRYVIPRSLDVIVGGTAEPGAWELEPRPELGRAMVERCLAFEPRLADAQVLGHAVGLRPGRAAVRLEAEARAGRVCVHNYGHGGSGVTVSWGCAEEVVELVRRTSSSPG